MSHRSRDEWKLYIAGEITDDRQRGLWEDHLYECDLCLEMYTECLEFLSPTLPLPDEADTERMIDQILSRSRSLPILQEAVPIAVQKREDTEGAPDRTEAKKRRKARSPRRTAFTHYAIAAAATFLLMTTGVFGKMTDQFSVVRAEQKKPLSTPVSDHLMEQTFAFFDSLHAQKPKGGHPLEP
ncbi:hypothetical protein [Paenibacillus sp. UNC499MF]|uniref:hypothetical protein n=1 Tax=Paenibacillus sp. UNC499MF TaxID=1502751 RepID=UPI0008A09898|nr:hypothetical protein [Paenibacillus sp. UNC499MF]SEG62997.1 hypothetical protein SAMN02799616_03918 [Paenibacillus sp. UNC499MF]